MKFKKGQMPWNKDKGLLSNKEIKDYIKFLFESKLPTQECNNLIYQKFKIKTKINQFWIKIYSKGRIKEHRSFLCRASKLGDKNPMKNLNTKIKSSNSHKGIPSWNKDLHGEEYLKHFKEGKIKGGGQIGFTHTTESRQLMSKNMSGKKHPNYNPSFEQRKQSAERMKKNRQDFDFNFKMFKSLQNAMSKPHKKVKAWIETHTALKTISNYPVYIGNRYAEIDEADIENKIAIFVDGNYWHNYPNLYPWDKTVNTCLINKGWKVYRFWESNINKNSEKIILELKSILIQVQQ